MPFCLETAPDLASVGSCGRLDETGARDMRAGRDNSDAELDHMGDEYNCCLHD